MIKRIYTENYGLVDVEIVNSVSEIPDTARYCFTDEETNLSIYESKDMRRLFGTIL